eukprot:scaffold106_cov246-Pinguiococcus_pyrenoidosus.AAC.8
MARDAPRVEIHTAKAWTVTESSTESDRDTIKVATAAIAVTCCRIWQERKQPANIVSTLIAQRSTRRSPPSPHSFCVTGTSAPSAVSVSSLARQQHDVDEEQNADDLDHLHEAHHPACKLLGIQDAPDAEDLGQQRAEREGEGRVEKPGRHFARGQAVLSDGEEGAYVARRASQAE